MKMNEEKLYELTDMLDDFSTRIEEFINTCEDEEQSERLIDTVSIKTRELLQELEYEMALLEQLGTDAQLMEVVE